MNSFKIYSLNTWLLPRPIAVDNRLRLKNIIKSIKHHDPEILNLQEVWFYTDFYRLQKRLPDYSFWRSGSGFFNKGGLVFGSKKHLPKPKSFRFTQFPNLKENNYVEQFARKGYFEIELENGVRLVNTHLNDATRDGHPHNTISQFEFIHEKLAKPGVIIAGDLNLHRPTLESLNTELLLPADEKTTVSSANRFAWMRFNKPATKDVQIDYVVASKKDSIEASYQVLSDTVVSDHYPIISEVKIH